MLNGSFSVWVSMEEMKSHDLYGNNNDMMMSYDDIDEMKQVTRLEIEVRLLLQKLSVLWQCCRCLI